MTSRRLSPRRLSVIRRHLDRGGCYLSDVIAERMIQEIDALRAERDTLASAVLSDAPPACWPDEAFALAERVLRCRICRACGDELEWSMCIWCDPGYAKRHPDDHWNLPLGAPCGVCEGTGGHYEECDTCAGNKALAP